MEYLALKIDGTHGIPIQIGPKTSDVVPVGGIGKIADLITLLINLIFIFGIIFCLLMLIFSGYMWITSIGDKQKLEQSKQRLTYSLVGLIIIFLAFFIIHLVADFFGVNFTDLPLSAP